MPLYQFSKHSNDESNVEFVDACKSEFNSLGNPGGDFILYACGEQWNPKQTRKFVLHVADTVETKISSFIQTNGGLKLNNEPQDIFHINLQDASGH